ncbi:MAG: hypothetical protein Q7S28_00835 [bacterium]|nr:hypothetical protein [bacterium]
MIEARVFDVLIENGKARIVTVYVDGVMLNVIRRDGKPHILSHKEWIPTIQREAACKLAEAEFEKLHPPVQLSLF